MILELPLRLLPLLTASKFPQLNMQSKGGSQVKINFHWKDNQLCKGGVKK